MWKYRTILRLGVILSVAVLTSIYIQSQAQAEDWLKGKSVRIMIGYPPGGGHDLEARVMGRHLSKYLPGKPSIIVQNMPGAGGIIQAAYVYNLAKPDGRTIGLFGGSHSTSALLQKKEDIKFNMTKMPVVWSVAGGNVDLSVSFLTPERRPIFSR